MPTETVLVALEPVVLVELVEPLVVELVLLLGRLTSTALMMMVARRG